MLLGNLSIKSLMTAPRDHNFCSVKSSFLTDYFSYDLNTVSSLNAVHRWKMSFQVLWFFQFKVLIRQESISKSLPLFSMSAITLSLCSLKVTVLTWTRLIHDRLMHVWIIWVHPAAKPQCRGPGSAQWRMCWKPSAVEVSFCWKVQACTDRNTSRLKNFLVM